MKSLSLAAALLLASTGVTAAQESVYNWSGIYLGGQAGYASDSGEAWYSHSVGLYGWEPEPDGIFGGIHGGANYQFSNNIVVGIETEINFGSGSDRAIYIQNGAPGPSGFYDFILDQKWFGSTRARIGYAFDRWMPFVTGGFAYGGYDFDLDNNIGPDGSGDDIATGWTVGLGAEYAFQDSWRIRASYAYSDLDFGSISIYAPDGSYYDGPFIADLESHAFSIGVSYGF